MSEAISAEIGLLEAAEMAIGIYDGADRAGWDTFTTGQLADLNACCQIMTQSLPAGDDPIEMRILYITAAAFSTAWARNGRGGDTHGRPVGELKATAGELSQAIYAVRNPPIEDEKTVADYWEELEGHPDRYGAVAGQYGRWSDEERKFVGPLHRPDGLPDQQKIKQELENPGCHVGVHAAAGREQRSRELLANAQRRLQASMEAAQASDPERVKQDPTPVADLIQQGLPAEQIANIKGVSLEAVHEAGAELGLMVESVADQLEAAAQAQTEAEVDATADLTPSEPSKRADDAEEVKKTAAEEVEQLSADLTDVDGMTPEDLAAADPAAGEGENDNAASPEEVAAACEHVLAGAKDIEVITRQDIMGALVASGKAPGSPARISSILGQVRKRLKTEAAA